MFFRFYKGNSPAVIILIILTGIIFWIPGFLIQTEPVLPFDFLQMPFFQFFYDILGSGWVAKLVQLAFIIITGFNLNRLNSEYGFLRERTQLPALFFILLNSAFLLLLKLTPAVFAGLLFLFSFEKILLSYRKENLSYNFFEAAFILSVATFFYLPLLFLWPFIFAGLIILRPVIWREWVLSFMGLILPFLLFFAVQFIRLGEIQSTFSMLINQFSIVSVYFKLSIPNIVILAWIGLLILLGSLMVLRTIAIRKVFSRKVLLFLFWIFVFSGVSWLLIDNADIEIIYFAAIPVSFLLSEYFLSMRSKRWKEILFTILLLSGMVSVYYDVFL